VTDRFDQLVARFLDGESDLGSPEHAELRGMLGSPERMASFVRLAAVDTAARYAAGAVWAGGAGASVCGRARGGWLWGRVVRTGLAAAAAVVLSAGALLAWSFGSRPGAGPALATVSGIVDGSGPGGLSAVALGDSLRLGERLSFADGAVEVRTASGAVVTVGGPASFEVVGPNAVALERGTLAAEVDPVATGFTARTPLGDVIDIGTRFVMMLDGELDVAVLEGAVRLEPLDGAAVELVGGAAAGVDAAGRPRAPRAGVLGRLSAGLGRPQLERRVLEAGPRWYHRMTPGRLGENAMSSGEYPLAASAGVGVAVGPSAGGGHRNTGLVFEPGDPAAEVIAGMTIGLETEAYSIVLWVRFDADGRHGVLAGSSNPGPAQSFNLTLHRLESGVLSARVGLRRDIPGYPLTNAVGDIRGEEHKLPGGYVSVESDAAAPVGVWTQVVVTASSGGALRLYVDGRRAGEASLDDRIEVRHERLLLGAIPSAALEPGVSGSLTGAVDEVAGFSRVLSEGEVAALYAGSAFSVNGAGSP